MPPIHPISPEELLRHAGWVRALARSLLRDPDAAEDVVQATWLAALAQGERDGPALPGWLARVARNFARKRLRGDARRERHETLAARSAAEPSAADLHERAALHRELVESVMALDEPYRSTILLRYFEELSPRAIARREGIPVRTVKTRLSRGLEKLRERLDARTGGDRAAWLGALAAFTRKPFAVGSGTTALTIMSTNLKLFSAGALLAALAATMFVFKAHTAGSPPQPSPPSLSAAARPADETSGVPRLAAGSTGVSERSSESGKNPTARAAPTAEPLDPDLDLHGVVTDSGGRPLRGARIEIRRSEARGFQVMEFEPELDTETLVTTTSSDERGEFRVRLAPARPFDLVASLRGYAERKLPSRFAGEEVKVVLTAGCTITGRITRKSGGAPCAGALVRAFPGIIHPIGAPEFRAEADEDGQYLLEGLPPDEIELVVEARDAVTRWGILVQGVEGAEIRKDLALEPGVIVAGVVADAETDLPIEGAEVLENRPGSPSNARTDADGRYALRVARGEAGFRDFLRAVASGFAEQQHAVEALSDDPIRLDFHLGRGRSAKGRVLGPDDWPAAGAIVIATGWGTEEGEHLTERRRVRTAADGTFELTGLADFAHHVLFLRKEGGGTKIYEFPLDEASRSPIDFGDLRLPDPATIQGQVVDEHGQGIADVVVFLRGANADYERFADPERSSAPRVSASRSSRTDDRGRFGFTDLAAGNYTLVMNGGFASAVRARREVRVEEGESLEGARLVLERGLSIEGRVVDPSGRPVAGVSVGCMREQAVPDPGPIEEAEEISHVDGSFRLQGLKEGKYTVTAVAFYPPSENGGGDFASGWWRAVSAGTRGLTLALPVAAWIEGTVVDLEGAPIAGVRIQTEPVEDDGADVGVSEWNAQSDAQGRFRVRVAAGSRVNLQAFLSGYFRGEAKAVAAGSRDVVVRFSPERTPPR